MNGAPSLACPECGRDARQERRLYRTRRRWRGAGPAIALLAGAVSLWVWAQVRRDGVEWLVARAPTAVVIAMLPEADETMRKPRLRWGMNVWEEEMKVRTQAGRLRDWHWRWALERTRVFRSRAVWHEGEPVRMGIWPPWWISGSIVATPRLKDLQEVRRISGLSFSGTFSEYRMARERFQRLGELAAGEHVLEFDVTIQAKRENMFEAISDPGISGRPEDSQWRGVFRMPVRIVTAEKVIIEPERGEALDAAAREAIKLRAFSETGGNAGVSIHIDRTGVPLLEEIALGCIIEVVHEGEVVEAIRFGREHEGAYGRAGMSYMNLATSTAMSARSAEELRSGGWALRVRGDAKASLREFDRERYWAGEFEIPLAEAF
jgi:hypothetical protein